jgi:hypothetical protein
MTARRAATIGLIFIAIAVIYLVVPTATGGIVDYAGLTMLLALGASMSIMAYVLLAGQRS